MTGKQKCKMLKEIRRRIADENDIPYVTHECSHQGECSGTCPRCEGELRYLERQLERRAALGKRVAVAALCAGMVLTASGCDLLNPGPSDISGDIVCVDERYDPDLPQDIDGEIEYVEPDGGIAGQLAAEGDG